MSSKQLVVFGGGLNGGILSGSLCYTSCVPEGKHVGQKDDTRKASTLSNEKKLGSPVGRFTTKGVEKTGISLSPRLENSSLLALAALNFALSAISRNRHVKRVAASALGAQYCALYFLPPEELRAVSRRRRGRAKERRGEERRGEERGEKRSGASEIKRQRRGERKEEEEEEEALQADVHNVWRNVGPKWEYRCGNGNEKIPRRTATTFYLPLFPRACTINLTYHFPRATVCSIFRTPFRRALSLYIGLHFTMAE
ncbi:hypothetical protein ALC57_18470 [Trachymyrmex cornetzi]|uniref:Uncharacterized protein n=1 Tax=Trachymyrmex cornetzi TaxID=471704 RepID=A0A151IRP7_9HYME|nr:hypothetical protein ALC57_18470 [Trachymyrmex cornetzi]